MTECLAGDKAMAVPLRSAISTEDVISMFQKMVPSPEVMMRREIEQMFCSIDTAMTRGVSEQQVIATLRKKWPEAHVATIIKLLNVTRDGCLQLGDHIECKPFGSMRKPKKRGRVTTVESIGVTDHIEGGWSP